MRLTSQHPLLTREALDRLFEPLRTAAGIVVAISGGPDSTALMHLIARWSDAAPRAPVLTATVDHGLRPEAAGEARMVAQAAAALGLPHQTLHWNGPKPRNGLQEAAREARYRLMLDCVRETGASHLVTAHTQDDQAETVLMRISRGSGLAGLAGMRTTVEREGILHVRPLLGTSKSQLIALCRANGWQFVDDPSNTDDRFARARWRKLMPLLAEEGLTSERLAVLAVRAARVEDALDAKARETLDRATLDRGDKTLRLRGRFLLEQPFEVAVRTLALALRSNCGQVSHVRLKRLETCAERLGAALREGKPVRGTLAGKLLNLHRTGELMVETEPERRRGTGRRVASAAASPHSLGKGGGHA